MIAGWGPVLPWMGIPVDPGAPDAQQWLRDELAKAPYQAAQPTWFDRLSQAIFDWFSSLSFVGDGSGGWIPLVATLIGIALLVAAVLVFGLPRRARRRRKAAGLFAADDRRTADQLRKSAAAAASAGDWTLASEEAFRAIAQGLAERTILRPTPGTTAHRVAELAGDAFPDERARLISGASVFESVRYLGGTGTEQGYSALVDLDADLRAARPRSTAPVAP
ncbi:hypothetical protein B7495_03285 [Cryobacterium sp. LW097]|nr:hypothetical protein B7495_03285 [Cryobacterium sp. LW097]TFC51742.1 DUF4129 domain-containing protein [Cryobacterium sp. TMB3-1-2]TFC68907.1 DUF4129 domain-containing protein [Cryobacterium sp. TMB3-15]TFC72239.1 DUF4129 domain-containing protein [Cryobacterium sp. TMB3-10]TFD39302.1 DUF4129 domain-containing protein [Cryobacterium sp. TMB3-12]